MNLVDSPNSTMAAGIARSGDVSSRRAFEGGKNGAGVYQTLISLMPPHQTYIEAFLGSGAVMRHKRPAAHNIAIERDSDVLDRFDVELPHLRLMLGDALTILRGWHFCLPVPTDLAAMKHTLVYADPPYLFSTRLRLDRPVYRWEFGTEEQHLELLEILMNLPCMAMISGYRSELYDHALAHWRRVDFTTGDRGGNRKVESVWLNFPEPMELHDYRYLGRGFRERERIKRKKARWRAKLQAMPAQERYALMSMIDELRAGAARQE